MNSTATRRSEPARSGIRLLLLLLLLLSPWSPAVNQLAAAPARPNVLLICVDDLKPVLGCYGDPLVKSPNIDRLAGRGVLFTRAYCNQAVCAPSRNSLLTGVRPTTLGIYDLGTNFRQSISNAVTLPQYFRQHGYRTEGLGKIFHVGHGNHEDPASWSVPHFQEKSIAYVLPASRSNQGLTREEALFANQTDVAKLPRGAAWESADVPDDAYPDGRIAAEAIQRLRAAKARTDTPFFLAVGFLKPHLPFCAPKKYWDLYDRAVFRFPEFRDAPVGAPKFAPGNWGELRQYNDIPATGPVTPEQARTLIHGYHAAVSYMDAQLGRVLDELDRLGLAENTIVVLWGDHGWHLGDHGLWCKHTNYEEANHIPLILAGPGVGTPGSRATNALVESIDLYPTLASLAGLPRPVVPQGLEGRDFSPVLGEPGLGARNYLFHVYPRGDRLGLAVRTTQYRLVEWKVPGAAADTAELELYDYVNDPQERTNLAPVLPRIVERLRGMLERLPEVKPSVAARAAAAKTVRDRTAMFEKRDTDHDRQLTRAEFMAQQPDPAAARERFEKFDANHDGVLSRDEFIHMGAVPKNESGPNQPPAAKTGAER